MNAARASLLALLLCWASAALALVAVPPLSGRVVDQTGTLSAGDIASLTQALQDLETRKGSQVAVLIVPTTDGEAIEQYALRVAEAWKIGRKKIDDGALLVIAKNDRRLRIEVGYGLEGALTDAPPSASSTRTSRRNSRPAISAAALPPGSTRWCGIVNGEKLPEPEPPHWQDSQSFNPEDLFNPFLIVPAIFFGGLLRSLLGTPARLGGRRRADGPDCLVHGRLGHGGGDRRRDRVALCVDQRRFHVSRAAGPPGQHWRLVRRLRRLMVQRQRFEQQRRLQWRRRQLWRRRRIGELVA